MICHSDLNSGLYQMFFLMDTRRKPHHTHWQTFYVTLKHLRALNMWPHAAKTPLNVI